MLVKQKQMFDVVYSLRLRAFPLNDLRAEVILRPRGIT